MGPSGYLYLLDVDYLAEKESTVVRLFGRDPDGNFRILIDSEFTPYFYVHYIDPEETKKRLEKNELVEKIEEIRMCLLGKESNFFKVYTSKPANMTKIRDTIKHQPFIEECYEHTLNHYKRYLRDKRITPNTWIQFEEVSRKSKNGVIESKVRNVSPADVDLKPPDLKIMSFDIEYVDDQVVLLSYASDETGAKVLGLKEAENLDKFCADEKEIIEEFGKAVNEIKPDILTGYNSDLFDFVILRERAGEVKASISLSPTGEKLKAVKRGRVTSSRIPGLIHIDLFQFVANIIAPQLESEILTLNEVAMELVGEGKSDLGYEGIIKLWREGPVEELVEYARNDAALTLKLSKELIPQIVALSRTTGELLFDTCRETFGLLVDNFLVKKAIDFGCVAPNLPKFEIMQKRKEYKPYKGGFVVEPVPGIHENLAVFDFRSLYPSIIVSFNISPETLNCECCSAEEAYKVPELGYHFCAKQKGFIPANLEKILKERYELKDKMEALSPEDPEYRDIKERQGALKVLANSFYGYMAFPGARWYSRECAESAAAFGRHFINQAIKMAQDYGEVIYGDTDSLFVKVTNENDVSSFLKRVNESLPGIMELELQGIYRKGLFVYTKEGRAAKKRYALLTDQNTLVIRGFETVRKDWCKAARLLQRKVLELVMAGKIEQAISVVKSEIERIKTRRVTIDELKVTAQLGKELEEYKQIGPHVVAAKKLISKGYEVVPGTQISYVITEGKGSISERAEPAEYVELEKYDIDYYLNNQIIPAAMRVLSGLGYVKDDFYS